MLKLDLHHRLNACGDPEAYSGASADVFAVDGKAYKLFRVYGVSRTPEQVKTRFESECSAYVRAASDAWLTMHVATFHGPCTVSDVIDRFGNSIKSHYRLDCCYVLDRLVGGDVKLYADGLREAYEHLRYAQNCFDLCGIDASDSSVFNHEDREQFKFIDFRIKPF